MTLLTPSRRARPLAWMASIARQASQSVRGQAGPLGRAVEQVGIDDLGPQVLERTGERLLDLDRDRSRLGRRAGGGPDPAGR